MGELVARFVIGGAVVSAFAILADLLKPKSFAGLFGAAPSVALATLALTADKDGTRYAALEARSMIIGAFAFFVYAFLVSVVLIRYKLPAHLMATVLITIWFIVAIGLHFVLTAT